MTWWVAMMIAATPPVVVRVDMQDALKLPNGFVTPPADPLIIFIQAPAGWVKAGALTPDAKKAVLAKMYGGPNWEAGNDDGSTYVVKAFASKVSTAAEAAKDAKHTWWYVVGADGKTLDKAGPGFGAPPMMKEPKSFIDQAEPGSVWNAGPKTADAKALAAWMKDQKHDVKIPVVLKPAVGGYSGNGAKCGALELKLSDTALGISLSDRAVQACGKDASPCEVWVIGRFVPPATFNVTKFDRAVTGREREMNLANQAWFQP